MLGMQWSWPDLVAAPQYVKQYCTDLLNLRREAQNARRPG